jgi:Putative zinc-binding metallo-peptidase
MPSARPSFRESNLFAAPIRDLRLEIGETPLAPVLAEFQKELEAKGITRLRPKFHLSTEWGVPFGTVVIGIPFYLARPELTDLHGEEVGHIEGLSNADILRYLRHEMGHVVNYAYKLYNEEEWVMLFGSITQPYLEDYRPQPFSRRYVRHLPGWYAQKHPDEDWAETFAVWMTPGRDWRQEYAQRPAALAKLEYCDRTIQALHQQDPPVVAAELDQDVGELSYSLSDFYKNFPAESEPSAGLDGDLKAIFDDLAIGTDGQPTVETAPAGPLIRRLERELMADVFRWTGHFPERTRSLMRHLAKRADALEQVYPLNAETEAIIGVTILVTSLAMNFVHRGSYFPEAQSPAAAAALAAERASEASDEKTAPTENPATSSDEPGDASSSPAKPS